MLLLRGFRNGIAKVYQTSRLSSETHYAIRRSKRNETVRRVFVRGSLFWYLANERGKKPYEASRMLIEGGEMRRADAIRDLDITSLPLEYKTTWYTVG